MNETYSEGWRESIKMYRARFGLEFLIPRQINTAVRQAWGIAPRSFIKFMKAQPLPDKKTRKGRKGK